MTEETFNDKKGMIMSRFNSAMKAKCWRTAKARLRDYAKLQSEFYSLDYEQTYSYLLQGTGL